MVEQWPFKPLVGGSSPPGPTNSLKEYTKMQKRKTIPLSETVRLVQIFETDEDGNNIAEYQDIEIADGRTVNTISFVTSEITSENLRTAADQMDMNRLVSTGILK